MKQSLCPVLLFKWLCHMSHAWNKHIVGEKAIKNTFYLCFWNVRYSGADCHHLSPPASSRTVLTFVPLYLNIFLSMHSLDVCCMIVCFNLCLKKIVGYLIFGDHLLFI